MCCRDGSRAVRSFGEGLGSTGGCRGGMLQDQHTLRSWPGQVEVRSFIRPMDRVGINDTFWVCRHSSGPRAHLCSLKVSVRLINTLPLHADFTTLKKYQRLQCSLMVKPMCDPARAASGLLAPELPLASPLSRSLYEDG